MIGLGASAGGEAGWGSAAARADCTNIIESMNSIVRQVCRNVKRGRNAKMGLRWTAAGMLEAKKGFRRLKAHKHLPVLKAALQNHRNGQSVTPVVERLADAA